jgi:hypothetical protein
MYFATEEEEEEYDETMASQKNEVQNVIKTLAARLEDLQTCSDLITKHGAALQRSLSELESLDTAQDVPTKLKSVNERATLFRITSNAMINVSVHNVVLFLLSRVFNMPINHQIAGLIPSTCMLQICLSGLGL